MEGDEDVDVLPPDEALMSAHDLPHDMQHDMSHDMQHVMTRDMSVSPGMDGVPLPMGQFKGLPMHPRQMEGEQIYLPLSFFLF